MNHQMHSKRALSLCFAASATTFLLSTTLVQADVFQIDLLGNFASSVRAPNAPSRKQRYKYDILFADDNLDRDCTCPFSIVGEECCCKPFVDAATETLTQQVAKLEAELAALGQQYSELLVKYEESRKNNCHDEATNISEEEEEQDLAEKWSAKGKKQRIIPRIDVVPDDDSMTIAERQLIETDEYMKKVIYDDESYAPVRDLCRNQNEMCTAWAYFGECDRNSDFMLTKCAPACQSCYKLLQMDASEILPVDVDPAWESGDLDRMFNRIKKHPYYSHYNPTAVSQSPWILTLDDFLSKEECDALIHLMEQQEASHDNVDGNDDNKDASVPIVSIASCEDDACAHDPVTLQVLSKIANLTNIADNHFDDLQLIRHNSEGKFRQTYPQDFFPADIHADHGPRILSIFLFLNDGSSSSSDDQANLHGGLQFDAVGEDGTTVAPKRGCVVIWPLVQNEHPTTRDRRTRYRGLPVSDGSLYGAMTFAYQNDYQSEK
jgi:hypothetical protein